MFEQPKMGRPPKYKSDAERRQAKKRAMHESLAKNPEKYQRIAEMRRVGALHDPLHRLVQFMIVNYKIQPQVMKGLLDYMTQLSLQMQDFSQSPPESPPG